MKADLRHTYSDEQLEFWGQIFVGNNLRSMGITFEFFLLNPRACLERWYASLDLEDPYPLLAEQIEVAHRLRLAEIEPVDELLDVEGRVVAMHGQQLRQPIHRRAISKKWKTNTRASA